MTSDAAPSLGFVRKLVAGDPYRRTRFHDEKGNLVDPAEWKYLPFIIQRFMARKLWESSMSSHGGRSG